jgi:hypothetical protein
MSRQALALIAIGAGSWLSWYPVIAARELVPLWVPLPLIAFLAATTTLLYPERRFGIVTAASLCTFLGCYSGYFIWLPLDGVSVSYVPLADCRSNDCCPVGGARDLAFSPQVRTS